MATRLVVAFLLLALLNACAPSHGVRPDIGQGAPLEYKPPTSSKPGKMDAAAFERALRQLASTVPLTLLSAQQGGLVRASYPGFDADARWQRLMSKRFGGICKPGQRRDDCLSLLDDVMGLSPWDKLGVGLALSIDPLKESISKAVEDTLAPQLFYTVIATGLVTWAVLAANPEPMFTKGAAIVSALLLIYLGVETFLEVVDASRELKWATGQATTWEELEFASQRFANRVGPAVARVFVLAVTVVVSHGTAGGAALLASRLSMLPRFSEAAAVGASQVDINLANVGQVSAVAVSTEGTITITLTSGAVAMVARSTRSGTARTAPKQETTGRLKDVYNGVTKAPGYPSNFRNIQNGTTRHPVTNKALLEKLRELEHGNWSKVYKDGWVGGDKVSLHYFESSSGKVFNLKIKPGWSNQ